MLTNHMVLLLFWMLYVFLHSFLVTPGTKQKVKSWLGEKFVYYRLFYNIFSALTLALLLWFQLSIPTLAILNPYTLLMIAGSVMSLAGLVIMIVCIRKYFFSLSGLQELVLEQTHTSGPLLVDGLHRYVRHPLYLGTFLFYLGFVAGLSLSQSPTGEYCHNDLYGHRHQTGGKEADQQFWRCLRAI